MAIASGKSGPYLETAESVTLSSGVATVKGKGKKTLCAESGTTDQLDQIVGLGNGDIAPLEPDTSDTITVVHNANLILMRGLQCVLSGNITLTVVGIGDNKCKEISRTY